MAATTVLLADDDARLRQLYQEWEQLAGETANA